MQTVTGARALSWLPGIYQDSATIQALLDSLGNELDQAESARAELETSFSVITAPEWALGIYENEMDLPRNPTIQTENDRRARILAFSRRGSHTATIANLEETLNQWTNAVVTITPDNPHYLVNVAFTDPLGAPPDLEFIQTFLRRIIPAHIDIDYTFTYFTWGELRALGWTWAVLRAQGMTWAELGGYNPEDNMRLRATKTITLTGAANLGAVGNLPIFATTGQVELKTIAMKCTTDLVSAGAGTLAVDASIVGATGNTNSNKLGATVATTIDANEFHIALSGLTNIMDSSGGGIFGTVAVGAITAGVLVFDVLYDQLSADGALT